MRTCQKCPALIMSVENFSTGKWMPIDAVPSEEGNIVLENVAGKTVCRVIAGHNLRIARARRETLYISHFATCPDAASFRKSKG